MIGGGGVAFSGDVGGGGTGAENSAQDQVCLNTGVFDAYHRLQADCLVVASFNLK